MLKKCPKCELNYITENENVCKVCAKEMKGEQSFGDVVEVICPQCNERNVVPGKELCIFCIMENKKNKEQIGDDEHPEVDADFEDLDIDALEENAMVELEEIDVDDEDFDSFDDDEEED